MRKPQPDPGKAPPGPLAGLRVLELTTTVAGPFCGRVLADFGAEVIKVEPPEGDTVRSLGKRVEGRSLYAASILRNKALISLDLRKPAAQQVVKKLAGACDVVVENFRPGTLEKWNLGYEALRADNPGLVLVRISGYGQDGPYSGRPGYGIIAENVSGLRHLTGDPDRPPPRIMVSLTDYVAGLYATIGTLMALHHRQRTGEGQVVDTALYEGAFSMMEPFVPALDKLGEVPMRSGSRQPDNTPNNAYPTGDGHHIHIAAPGDGIFRRLAKVMGREDLPADPRFATLVARSKNEAELDGIIAAWSQTLSLDELEARLHAADVPASRAFTLADIYADPHFAARQMLVRVPDPNLGSTIQAGVAPRLSATPGAIRWSGRETGADTRGVLRELGGLADAEIDRLVAEGAAFCGGGPEQG